ncbi:hypothetical protein [Pseudoalteromonas phage J2-1_QLiu-2017]|nr:hypothetical protein [Pseudoalteromonas phage J2-1_QLiu-2017]
MNSVSKVIVNNVVNFGYAKIATKFSAFGIYYEDLTQDLFVAGLLKLGAVIKEIESAGENLGSEQLKARAENLNRQKRNLVERFDSLVEENKLTPNNASIYTESDLEIDLDKEDLIECTVFHYGVDVENIDTNSYLEAAKGLQQEIDRVTTLNTDLQSKALGKQLERLKEAKVFMIEMYDNRTEAENKS